MADQNKKQSGAQNPKQGQMPKQQQGGKTGGQNERDRADEGQEKGKEFKKN